MYHHYFMMFQGYIFMCYMVVVREKLYLVSICVYFSQLLHQCH